MFLFKVMVLPPGFHSIAIKLSGTPSPSLCNTGTISILGCLIEGRGFSFISHNVCDCKLIPNVWFIGKIGMMWI